MCYLSANILIYFIPKKQTTDNSLDTKKIVKIPSDSPVGTVVGVASGMTAITNFTLEGPLSKYFEVDHMGKLISL